MPGKNAVVKRIELLTNVWRDFTEDPLVRVLRLRLGSEAGRLLDAFLAYHGEEASDLDDLFLPIVVPAQDVDTYWNEVQQQIVRDIGEAKDDLDSLDIPTQWQPPAVTSGGSSAQTLIDTLASFQAYYQDLFDHATVVLLPSEIASRELWIECMNALVASGPWPPSVRVLVPDWLPETLLQDWSVKHSSVVATVTPKLDMPGLPLELLAHLPSTGPGFEFRRLFVQLGAAASSGQITQIPGLAHRAMMLATDQGWFALAATVQLLVGGALAATGQSDKVLEAYRSARQLAAKIDDPTAPKVAVTSAMAEAGALLTDGQFREARQVYLEAARAADQGEDAMSSMDAHRMASYCAESSGDLDQAWDDAQAAVVVARNMEGETRRDSTLPALLHRMEEMARRPEMMARNLNVQRECEELLGNQWKGVIDHTKTLLS